MASANIPTAYIQETLTCSVCLELVEDPQTLTQCLHSFCQQCVVKLMNKDSTGVTCPNCRKFTSKDNIRSNYFMKDLAEKIKSQSKTDPQMCEQCPDGRPASEITWRCLDCKVNLCDICKSQHKKLPILRGHRILELSEDTGLVVDHLVFCTTHADEPIKFFCKQCNISMCITCHVVTHKNHEIVTVQDALDEFLPSIESDLKLIDQTLDVMEMNRGIICNKEETLRMEYSHCKSLVEKSAEQRMEEIQKHKDMLVATLTKEEEKQIQHLQDQKKGLMDESKEIVNIRNVARTCIERARHTSLLSELIDGGIREKLKELKSQKPAVFSLTLTKPTFELSESVWTDFKRRGCLGNVKFSASSTVVKNGFEVKCLLSTGSRYYGGVFVDTFEGFIELLEIELPGYCPKLSLIGNSVWAPIRDHNKIEIFSEEGNFKRSVKIQGRPSCIEETPTGCIMLACADKGLYSIDKESYGVLKIHDGTYSDICCYENEVFVWDYQQRQILKFVKQVRRWKVDKVICAEWIQKGSVSDTMVISQCKENTTKKNIFLGCQEAQAIYRINEEDGCATKFDNSNSEKGAGHLCNPRLCAVDSEGHLLVADQGHMQYKIVTTEGTFYKLSCLYKTTSNVYDMKINSKRDIVWCSQQSYDANVLRKYKILI